MIAEKLRKAVLQAAMEGKLTNQDLNDNSVVEILTKIEMNKGIKFRVINEDEKPYSIPMNWVWISHNDILEISGGSQPPKSTFSELPKENYIRLYQIRDYGSNPQPVYIPIETATKQTKKGDILLARYGASLGQVFYAEEGAYNVAMAKVIPLFKEDILYNDFLFYYYKSSQYQSLVLRNTRSAQAGFNKNDLNKLLIALPPIEEQKRIVEKLEVLLAEIDKLEQDEKSLKELEDKFPVRLKKSLLKSAIGGNFSKTNLEYENKVDKLKYQNNESLNEVESLLGKINHNWIVTNLKQIADISTGRKDANHAKQNGIYRFYTCAKEYFMSDTFSFEGESLILPGNGANVGQVYRYSGKFEAYQRTYIIQLKSNFYQYIDMNYLEYLFHAYWGEYNKNKMFGSATPYIKLGNLVNFPVVIPPIEEQKRIVEKLDKLFAIDLLNI